uniref:NADH dehydrogenase subunit 6 n=1 Tax=Spirocerca lupi TaxID=304461 RepID=M9QD40_9BILA|nr:NADH dehydrogenase subunit 6 [Spirocerca lupi]AGI51578.1 NADH dehydrogenase subunit 6 [Spirocerca lupi]
MGFFFIFYSFYFFIMFLFMFLGWWTFEELYSFWFSGLVYKYFCFSSYSCLVFLFYGLIFLSGVLSLLTYVCGLVNYNMYYNYVFFGVLFFFVFFWYFFFGGDFYFDFFSDFNFLLLYYDINYLSVFWLVIILILLLNFISFNLKGTYCLRGL